MHLAPPPSDSAGPPPNHPRGKVTRGAALTLCSLRMSARGAGSFWAEDAGAGVAALPGQDGDRGPIRERILLTHPFPKDDRESNDQI